MDEKLVKFLESIKIEGNDCFLFSNAKLLSSTYSKATKTFKIKIGLNAPLSVDGYALLAKSLKNFPYPAELEYSVDSSVSFTEEEIGNYLEYFKKKYFSQLQVLEGINYSYTPGKLAFRVKTNIQEDLLIPLKSEIANKFALIGINLNVVIKVEKDESLEQKVKEETDGLNSRLVAAAVNELERAEKEAKPEKTKPNYYKTEIIEAKINDLTPYDKNICITAKVIRAEAKELKTGRLILSFDVTDGTNSITCKIFEGARFSKEDIKNIKEGMWLKITGNVENDSFDHEEVLMASKIEQVEVKEESRIDDALEKRVELHLHSKMSAMDGINSIKDYVARAEKWGHKAIAITDHDNLQSYPDAQNALKGKNIKMIYGLEATMSHNKPLYTFKPALVDLSTATYVVFDIETSGFSSSLDSIIEIGAVKCQNGVVIDRFQTFINVDFKLQSVTTELTGITDAMLKGQPKIEQAIDKFKSFIEDTILVAHNATFDIGFIKSAFYKQGYTLENPVIDTLNVARRIYPNMKRYNLKALCKNLKVEYDSESAHRADYDAEVTYHCFDSMLTTLIQDYGIETHKDFDKLIDGNEYKRVFPYHVTLLVKNQEGLKDLFKLVSRAHTETFVDGARVRKEDIDEFRTNLLVGSACCNSQVFEIAQTKTYEELKEYVSWYDYIEIQPLDNYSHLIATGKMTPERLEEVIEMIVKAAKETNKILVATGDVHYLDPEDKIARTIYINSKAIGGAMHPLFDYDGRIKEYPNQHFRTTKEMLRCFEWLGEDLAYEMVVTNTNKIADMIETVTPLKTELYTPKMEGAEQTLEELCYKTAKEIYGDPLPEIVQARIEKELKSIIGNGFAVIYYIAHKLVKKSNEDGYIVGSRGSVGSSVVATFTGITEVNGLPPHYVCPHCQYSEWFTDGSVASGFDLPEKNCPKCGMPLKGDGHDIPFETFLGFKGDKVPDIDLNFSGDYQPRAHDFTKVMFGEDNVFRAGTIGTVAEKTAYGYVKAYFENNNLPMPRKAEINRLAKKCEGVKRTTGQHPGGIVVIPQYMDVFDFTPINYPADDLSAAWRTTHFDFHAIHDNILKLDILGHVDPTQLRMLYDLTGIDPKTVNVSDDKVLALFAGPEVMGVTKEQVLNETGTTGVSEFNTPFTKKMVLSTKPNKFSDLVQISGLSHGTDVWNGNAEELIKSGVCTIKTVIGCRDDIMVYLMHKGLEPGTAFKIMEAVRKGKGLTPEFEEVMKDHNVPSWYLDSCKKIKYMFPKAHAVAYVMMALRSTWYKIYKPLHFYAAYFSTRCNIFDIKAMTGGYASIKKRYEEILDKKRNHEEVSAKEEEIASTLENALEMTARGYTFANINIDKSAASNFIVDEENNQLIPPFTTIDGLGLNVANSIVKAREENPFLSRQDLMQRTQVNGTQKKIFEELGALDELSEANQLTLF
ncbi:MAG: PolC-type DNA polymerase III [Erysipelotrichaceae bacterium]|nr:PolC-type DNA polymerase III [Erysipelotrichaceae bacterium]